MRATALPRRYGITRGSCNTQQKGTRMGRKVRMVESMPQLTKVVCEDMWHMGGGGGGEFTFDTRHRSYDSKGGHDKKQLKKTNQDISLLSLSSSSLSHHHHHLHASLVQEPSSIAFFTLLPSGSCSLTFEATPIKTLIKM